MPTFVIQLDRARLKQDLTAQVLTIARDTGNAMPQKTYALDPADERALRGIPAIGRGVTGAIPHTIPGRNLR